MRRNRKLIYRKAIVSGNVLEVYEYEQPILKGDCRARSGRANAVFTSEETKQENRMKTASRARSYVRRFVNANPHLDKFLTLTFAENVTDIERANHEFKKFILRLGYLFPSLQYVKVTEFQARGAVHFHLLCNLPYVEVEQLAKIWGNGFIKLNRIDNVDNVGAYITKYMSKDSIDPRLAGHKCYTMSKGLKQPKCIEDEEEIDELLGELEDVKRMHSSEFVSEYYGTVRYTQIVCSRETNLNKRKRRISSHIQVYDDDGVHPFTLQGVSGRAPIIA